MSLKQKILLIIISTLTLLIFCTYIIATMVLQESFSKLEDEELRDNMHRIQSAFADEFEKIKTLNYDYSSWDDMYSYIDSPNATFIRSNLEGDVIKNQGLNYVDIINRQNQSLFSRFHIKNDQWLNDTAGIVQFVRQKFNQPDQMEKVQAGFILSFSQPILFVSRPIKRTDESGLTAGVYVTLKYLDQDMIEQIRQRTLLNFEVLGRSTRDSLDQLYQIKSYIPTDSDYYLITINQSFIHAHFFMNDLDNQSHIYFRLIAPRRIYIQGQSTIHYLLGLMVIIAVGITILTIGLFYKLVLSRLDALNVEIKKYDTQPPISLEILNKGKDEFARIIESFLHHSNYQQEDSCQDDTMKRDQLLFNDSITSYIFIDRIGQIIQINPAGLRLLGVSSMDQLQSYSVLSDQNLAVAFPDNHLPDKEIFIQIPYETEKNSLNLNTPPKVYNLIFRYLPIADDLLSNHSTAYIQLIAI